MQRGIVNLFKPASKLKRLSVLSGEFKGATRRGAKGDEEAPTPFIQVKVKKKGKQF